MSLQAVDSNSTIYELFSIWKQKGHLNNLPIMRPYPIQVIKNLLNEVVSTAEAGDRDLAKKYLAKLSHEDFGKDDFQFLTSDLVFLGEASQKGVNQSILSGINVHALGFIGEEISFSGHFDYWFQPSKQTSIDLKYMPVEIPMWEIGPSFSVGETLFTGFIDTGVDFVIGNAQTYLQMGLIQPAFGPFARGNVVIGDNISPTPRITITHQEDRFDATGTLFELKAIKAVTKTGDLYFLGSSPPGEIIPTKYLTLHAVNFRLTPRIEIGVFQMSLSGQRISLYNVLPLPFIFTEPYMGNFDNVLGGTFAHFDLPFQLSVDFLLFIDDWQLVEGWHYSSKDQQVNLDPFANKTAGQMSLVWTPDELSATRFLVGYQFIAPYMYTHSSHALLNYMTYTHNGHSFGSSLSPNSDQWMLEVSMSDSIGLSVWSSLRFISHGNGSDHGAGSVDGDGSIWDDGYNSSGGVTFYGDSTFLNQSVIEESIQFEVTMEYELVLDFMIARTQFSYGFEHIKNKDLVVTNENIVDHLFGIGFELAI